MLMPSAICSGVQRCRSACIILLRHWSQNLPWSAGLSLTAVAMPATSRVTFQYGPGATEVPAVDVVFDRVLEDRAQVG